MTSFIVIDPKTPSLCGNTTFEIFSVRITATVQAFFRFSCRFLHGTYNNAALMCYMWFKMAVVRHLEFVIGHRGPPTKPPSRWVGLHPAMSKFRHDRLSSLQVKRFWIVSDPQNSVFGDLDPLNMICDQQCPQKAHLGENMRVLSHKYFISFHICDL